MLLHYLWKLKIQISADLRDIEENANKFAFSITFNFVIHPQILIFSVFEIAIESFPILIANTVFRVAVF